MVTTGEIPWSFSAHSQLAASVARQGDTFQWLSITCTVLDGAVGVSIYANGQTHNEKIVEADVRESGERNGSGAPTPNGARSVTLALPPDLDDVSIMIRNGPREGPSKICIECVEVLSQSIEDAI
jgi:hypothetical protein